MGRRNAGRFAWLTPKGGPRTWHAWKRKARRWRDLYLADLESQHGRPLSPAVRALAHAAGRAWALSFCAWSGVEGAPAGASREASRATRAMLAAAALAECEATMDGEPFPVSAVDIAAACRRGRGGR